MNLQRVAETGQWTRKWLIAFQPDRSHLRFYRQEHFASSSVFCNDSIVEWLRDAEWQSEPRRMTWKQSASASLISELYPLLCLHLFSPTGAWLNIHSVTIFINIGMACHIFLLFFKENFFYWLLLHCCC